MDNKSELWSKCVAFHGHLCGGLAVGYQASLLAMELLDITGAAEDEEIVCITENNACGVDAIQALLGCTFGKGNLIAKPRGKQAFSFYSRNTGKSVRLVLRRTPELSKEERRQWLMSGYCHEMFDIKEPVDALPGEAVIYRTCVCDKCGEPMAENHTHLSDGSILCDDCYPTDTRAL